MRSALPWLLAAALTVAAPAARAQEAPKPPSALAGLAKTLGRKATPPADARVFQFKPAAKPVFYDTLIGALVQDAEQKKALRQILVEGGKAVEAELARAGHPNDLSAGLVAGITVAWKVATGESPSDKASEALLAQLRSALDGPELRASSDVDKQKMYEFGVGVAVFLTTMEELATDAEGKKGLKVFAGQVIEQLAGAGPDALVIDDNGIRRNEAQPAEPKPTPTATGGYQYDTTTFGDGWTSRIEAGWVRVTKGNLAVLIHYPDARADAYNPVLRDGLQNAWNLLVAPHYTDIRNVALKPIQSFESIAFAEADATDRATGKRVHVVLFKKHASNGNGRYLEFVSPSKAAFEAEFGPYRNEEFGWDKLAGMQNANRFVVAARDLAGTWTTSNYASLVYYFVDSGRQAGATATSTSDAFTFDGAGGYHSDHAGASGKVGNQKFSRQQYRGKFVAEPWKLTLTNRFEGANELYQCHFEAVRGGRILLLTDRLNTTLALVKK